MTDPHTHIHTLMHIYTYMLNANVHLHKHIHTETLYRTKAFLFLRNCNMAGDHRERMTEGNRGECKTPWMMTHLVNISNIKSERPYNNSNYYYY